MRTKITIRKDGTIAGILDEGFDTSEIGRRVCHRLSDVYWSDADQGWRIIDRTTERLLPQIFPTRKAALKYEVWYMGRKFRKVLKFAGVK